ncbi:hypothetical protein [uncultured Tyzzerella sp.]|uniref:hypothetical protein n=1 Tax=uncultured Tyzzerella sp. TaxID=2321398 RepID=UPI002943A5E0|nr:hypothetical protein [uncultured Tyzzerella sp.]
MKNKKGIIVSIIAILVIAIVGCYFLITKNNTRNKGVILDQKILKDLDEFNRKLDDYYIQTWDNNQFLSSYSYLVKNDGSEVLLSDIEESLDYKVPKELKDIVIHFTKPKHLKPYLQDKILDEDMEILTIYTALPVKEGMYVSSKFDEGGVLTQKEYKQFVMDSAWNHGEIRTPLKDDKEYEQILKAVVQKDGLLENGNVKYIACDDKYAIIVISSKMDPAYIKQYALQKDENGEYSVIVEDLQSRNSKIFVNYAYTDFDLSMLPPYEISKYTDISSDLSYIVDLLKQSGQIGAEEEITYACKAGNFAYIEFKSNLKVLLYTNAEGKMDIYEVDNFKTALSQMIKLEDNPPAFILNFE